MNTGTKLAGFGVGVAALFAGAFGVGAVAGPLDVSSSGQLADHRADANHGSNDAASGSEHNSQEHDSGEAGAEEPPGGLMISQDGYTLDLPGSELLSSPSAPLRFRILGPGGDPVTRYTEEHGKDLHLIVVRRDMAGYQHVHPTLDDAGEWSVDLDLSAAGEYRMFADFVPEGGEGLTLGADLSVAGAYDPKPLPEPEADAEIDGYTVSLDGNVAAGESSLLTLSARKGGEPVTDLQPYLGAYGHLVALRDGDLAYLHVHPDGSPGDGSTKPGPDIRFYATAPTPGDYRLFLDFRHDDKVRTAEFTVRVGEGTGAPKAGDKSEHAHSH